MSKRLVILGGSFNPPTLAHKQLLEQVINALQADLGLYVPSSDFYVGRKVRRQNSHYQFSQKQRYQMLESMLADNTKVNTCEYDTQNKGQTHVTLLNIQREYPGYTIYFIMGDDKLNVLPKWQLVNFLGMFNIVVIPRTKTFAAITREIKANAKLRPYLTSFVILKDLDVSNNISSTMVQDLYYAHNFTTAKQYVTEFTHIVCQMKARSGRT